MRYTHHRKFESIYVINISASIHAFSERGKQTGIFHGVFLFQDFHLITSLAPEPYNMCVCVCTFFNTKDPLVLRMRASRGQKLWDLVVYRPRQNNTRAPRPRVNNIKRNGITGKTLPRLRS